MKNSHRRAIERRRASCSRACVQLAALRPGHDPHAQRWLKRVGLEASERSGRRPYLKVDAPSNAMAFLKEFLSDFIQRTLMEDPVKRRELRNKHIADVSAKAAVLCVPLSLVPWLALRFRNGSAPLAAGRGGGGRALRGCCGPPRRAGAEQRWSAGFDAAPFCCRAAARRPGRCRPRCPAFGGKIPTTRGCACPPRRAPQGPHAERRAAPRKPYRCCVCAPDGAHARPPAPRSTC